ncbi:MAG: hypothetical protein FWH22_02610 [Fibromonadales bacterium]|nr:hypothetical protein [Fibromonadales bacterium]
MKYNPDLHNRHSIRLRGYDYASAGMYFVTICCQNQEHLFGKIIDGKMILNECGKIAMQCWQKIPRHFPNAILHEHVIMPNHIHCVIELTNAVGAKNLSPIRNERPQHGNERLQHPNIHQYRFPAVKPQFRLKFRCVGPGSTRAFTWLKDG